MFLPALADDAKPVLPSETGIVENIKYEDADNFNRGEQTTKQLVTIKVLTGDFKGTERIVENMLTGNPAYDINLNKGDKVVLHVEPVSYTVSFFCQPLQIDCDRRITVFFSSYSVYSAKSGQPRRGLPHSCPSGFPTGLFQPCCGISRASTLPYTILLG